MVYRPNATVPGFSNGRTVGVITTFRGRRTIYERPNAGYATVQFQDDGFTIVPGGSISPFLTVGTPVEIRIDLPVWTWASLETSWSSVAPVWSEMGNVQYVSSPIAKHTLADWVGAPLETTEPFGQRVVGYSMQTIGPLAALNRIQIFPDGRAQELDGARVLAALSSAIPTQDASIVDDGVYSLAALGSADGGYNALIVAQNAGFSGEGVLYETADGQIGYADSARRKANADAGFVEFDFDDIAINGITFSSSLANLTNRVVLDYDAGTVEDSDAFSIGVYGQYETRITTQLASLSDAEERAAEFLNRHADPQTVFEQITFNLTGLDDSVVDRVLDLDINDAIALTNVPVSLGFSRFEGFVEGIALEITPVAATLTLIVSDYRLSVLSDAWQDVDASLSWQGMSLTQTWREAAIV